MFPASVAAVSRSLAGWSSPVSLALSSWLVVCTESRYSTSSHECVGFDLDLHVHLAHRGSPFGQTGQKLLVVHEMMLQTLANLELQEVLELIDHMHRERHDSHDLNCQHIHASVLVHIALNALNA